MDKYKIILKKIALDSKLNNDIELLEEANKIIESEDKEKSIVCKIFKFKFEKDINRYKLAQDIVNSVIEIKKNFWENKDDLYLNACILNEVLVISTIMNIELKNILEIVFKHIEQRKDIQIFIKQLILSINKINKIEIVEKFEWLFEENINELFLNKEVLKMEGILEKLENNKAKCFDKEIVIRNLIELYLKDLDYIGDLGNISNLMRVLLLAKKLEERDIINKALQKIEENIKQVKLDKFIDMDNINNDIKFNYKRRQSLLEIFFKKITARDVIKSTSRGIRFKSYLNNDEEYIYNPVPNFNLKKVEGGVFLKLLPIIYLDENKIVGIGNGEDNLYNRIIYSSHIQDNVIPYLNYIYSYNVKSLKEIRCFFSECGLENDEIFKYYLRIEKYFSKDKYFEFTTLSIILIEKILRYIYSQIKGTSIREKNTNVQEQVGVNLQDIFKDDDLKNFLGKNLYAYLSYTLIDIKGVNIRNKIMHGLVKEDDFNLINMYILMHIILILLSKIEQLNEINEITNFYLMKK